jgi:GTPase SAR1 family protein
MVSSSFQYYYSLIESNGITIDQVENLKDDKLFVAVLGGVGSGKTYLTNKFLRGLSVIEDTELSGTSNNINEQFNKKITQRNSFVYIYIGQNFNNIQDKLTEAKQHKFTNILIFLDTNPQKILTTDGLKYYNQSIIIETYKNCLNHFECLKIDNKLVDFFVQYKK